MLLQTEYPFSTLEEANEEQESFFSTQMIVLFIFIAIITAVGIIVLIQNEK